MEFDPYFDQLVLREGDWLEPARGALRQLWPQVPIGLGRASQNLYEEVFGKPSDDALPGIDKWFYRASVDLGSRRPIDLVGTLEGVPQIRRLLIRMSVGLVS